MVSVKRLEIDTQSAGFPDSFNKNFVSPEIIDLKAEGCTPNKCYHIETEISNDSDYPIVEILTHVGSSMRDITSQLFEIVDRKNPIYIGKQQNVCIRFVIPADRLKSLQVKELSIHILFCNIFDYCTKTTLTLNDLNSLSSHPSYSFRLAKFTDIKPKGEVK